MSVLGMGTNADWKCTVGRFLTLGGLVGLSVLVWICPCKPLLECHASEAMALVAVAVFGIALSALSGNRQNGDK